MNTTNKIKKHILQLRH